MSTLQQHERTSGDRGATRKGESPDVEMEVTQADEGSRIAARKALKQRGEIRKIIIMIVVGILAGALSGLFGIGGGSIIVPALVWIGMTQRHAVATSLLAIIPLSISGVVSYAASGDVDWVAAVLMIIGTVIGSQIGSWLLSRLSELWLRWIFAVFLAFVTATQLVLTPLRDSTIHMTVIKGILLVALGMVIGILSALLGVGGGAITVPALSLLFGASDLIARGTSLLAMFPSAITGTIANWKRGLVDFRNGLIIGIAAAIAAPLGTYIAGMVSAKMGSYLLGAYLFIILLRSTWTAMKITPGIGPKLPRK